MADCIVSFVLSGGNGTRLWPLSRRDRPKQFHELIGNGTMLARTLRRLKAREQGETVLCVVASSRHAGQLRQAMAPVDLNGGSLILEPVARNTAAAIAVATLHRLAAFGDGLMLIAPADHDIATDRQFWATIETGVAAAEAGRLVVFGVPPTRAETGYGYIEAAPGPAAVRDVRRFVEKPDGETAKTLLASGCHFWNAGIFLARAGVLEQAFARFQPDLLSGAKTALAGARTDAGGLHLPAAAYRALPERSFDRAILEKADNIAMVPAGFCWTDVGSWRSLREIGPADADGNVMVGDVMAIDCHNSYLRSDGRLLSVVGLDEVAVVATGDAVFVAPLGRSQDVSAIVARLELAGRSEGKAIPAPRQAARKRLLPGVPLSPLP